jgi:hypothetical protein
MTTASPAPERTDRDTAPLPPAARVALETAERKVAAMAAADLADQYTTAASTYRMLSASTGWMASAEFDRMLCAVDEMGHCREQLAKAGRLDRDGGAA